MAKWPVNRTKQPSRIAGLAHHRVYSTTQTNAYAERFVRTIKEGCLDRMIFFGEASLRRAIREFMEHYHHERNHQGLDNRLIDPLTRVGSVDGAVACRERLGGVLRYYYRNAA